VHDIGWLQASLTAGRSLPSEAYPFPSPEGYKYIDSSNSHTANNTNNYSHRKSHQTSPSTSTLSTSSSSSSSSREHKRAPPAPLIVPSSPVARHHRRNQHQQQQDQPATVPLAVDIPATLPPDSPISPKYPDSPLWDSPSHSPVRKPRTAAPSPTPMSLSSKNVTPSSTSSSSSSTSGRRLRPPSPSGSESLSSSPPNYSIAAASPLRSVATGNNRHRVDHDDSVLLSTRRRPISPKPVKFSTPSRVSPLTSTSSSSTAATRATTMVLSSPLRGPLASSMYVHLIRVPTRLTCVSTHRSLCNRLDGDILTDSHGPMIHLRTQYCPPSEKIAAFDMVCVTIDDFPY
jgi:hypothetical protein